MANIKLYGNTWDTSSVYDDAQGKTQKQINAKAATNDGYFEDMTVGTAEQLLSSKYTEDKVPYSFRQTGGGVDVGKRAEEMVVGGTVVWNQLMQNGNFQSTSGWADDFSVLSASNNILSMSPSQADRTVFATRTITNLHINTQIVGHKYLGVVELNPSVSCKAMLQLYNVGAYKDVSANTWQQVYTLINLSEATNNYTARFNIYTGSTATFDTSTVVQFRNCKVFDLTKMFGSTVADAIYAMETATTGTGVAYFRSLFPNSYYAYNAGTLMSVNAAAHQTVGFNLWDGEYESGYYDPSTGEPVSASNWKRIKNPIRCLPNTRYLMLIPIGYADSMGNVIFCTSDGKTISTINGSTTVFSPQGFVTPENCYYIKWYAAPRWFDGVSRGFSINLFNPAKNGTYEPYVKHTYPLDSTLTLRGIPKLDSNNKLYHDGDTYESDGTVTRKYSDVTITSSMVSTVGTASTGIKYAMIVNLPYNGKDNDNIVSAKYLPHSGSAASESGFVRCDGANLYIYDNAFTDLATAKSLLDGMHFVYELVTPTTESASPYTNPQICDPNGTEEYVDAGVLAEERDVSVPVGHETKYGEDLVGKLEALPPIPDAPTTNGTYDLRVVVSGGEPTYSWVSV